MTDLESSLSNFERLSKNLHLMALRAESVNSNFVEKSYIPEVCTTHILFNQMVARATVPLMEEVIVEAEKNLDDPVSYPLIKYMKKHIAEETDHDKWYADDLVHHGMSKDELFSIMPSGNIAALSGSQYYWIKHHHPVAFMGYLACLEVYHPTVEYVQNLINNSGLPAEGFSTYMEHAVIDTHHSKDIINTLDSLPLSESQFRIVEQSAFQTFRYVALIMEDVIKVASKQQ